MAQHLDSGYPITAMKKSLFLFLFLSSIIAAAQVDKVRQRAEQSKQSSSSSSSEGSFDTGSADDDILVSIFADITWAVIQLPFKGFYHWQVDQLERAKLDDWRVSAELEMPVGLDPSRNTYLILPSARLNWGLFSTQVRYNRLFDETGSFNTLDWQILQFNIVNNDVVRFLYGFGLSHETEIDQTHFESMFELDVFLLDRHLMPSATFRWSGDGFPRREIGSRVSYRLNPDQTFSNTVSLGYTFQDWYDVPFHFATLSVGIFIQ